MKLEDIDKRIGMPDVDKEWARFEQEVIAEKGKTKRRIVAPWALGIGIAASVALLFILNMGKEQAEQVSITAQTEEIKLQPTHQPAKEEVQAKEQELATKTPMPLIAQNKKPASTKANASATSSLEISVHEYAGAVQRPKMDDLEGLAFESVDQALQDITSADLGPNSVQLVGTSPNETEPGLQGQIAGLEDIDQTSNLNLRLRGDSQELITSVAEYVPDEDEVRLLPQGVIGGSPYCPPNDSILYIVNGVPQPKENNKWLGKMSYLDYFKRQHLLVDSVKRNMNEEAKQRYLERFGMAAKHGVVEYFCVEDTLCDYYMNQHEELKASRRRVSGVVLDENDEPLDHTIIHILQFEPEKKIWGVETTDSLGNFAFWVPRTGVKMHFTYIGYKTIVIEPTDTFQTIYLLPNDNLKSLRESLKF